MQIGGNLGEFVLGILGVIVVLALGSMWRRNALQEQVTSAKAEAEA
jgi:hypothetical protein